MIRSNHLRRPSWWYGAFFLGLAILLMVVAVRLIQQGTGRTVLVYALLFPLGVFSLIQPRAAIVSILVFQTLLGFIRRALIPLLGWSSQDPILLAGPIIAMIMVAASIGTRRTRLDSPLAIWILVLMSLMTLEIANPLQGPLQVGLAGALFYLVPLLWFWIGRTYTVLAFVEFVLFRLVITLALFASLLGFYQVFYGLFPFEEQWVKLTGYGALFVEGHLRPFSFFVSATEYAYFLGIALVVLWARWLTGVGTRVQMLLLAPLALALFLIGTRGVIVFTVFAAALAWTVQGRNRSVWLPRLALALVLSVAGMAWTLSQAQQIELAPGRVSTLVQHQIMGLLHPLNPGYSTLWGHIVMFLNGLGFSFTHPLGLGLGASTQAVGKFGTGGMSTEIDISNLFVSLGVLGGGVYVLIIVLVIITALGYWHRSRSTLALAIFAVLVLTLGQWLTGGHYGVTALIWFCIGALDRLYRMERIEPDEAGHRYT